MRVKGTSLYLSKFENGNSRGSMRLFFTILLLMLILRHKSIGIDSDNYQYIFGYIARSSWSKALGRSTEIAYSALNKIISLFTDDFIWVQAATAILSVCFLSMAYERYSKDAALTIALFLMLSNFILLFSGLRQAITISMGFAAFEQVRQKKLFSFLLIVAISILFHTSAFMLIFMYPLYHVRITKNWLFWIVPAMGAVFVFNRQIFGVLTVLLSMYT